MVVKSGRMRNTLYPYSMAQYIHPGADTFLTQHKLAVPVGPNYRRMLRSITPNPARSEVDTLVARVILSRKLINDRRDEDY